MVYFLHHVRGNPIASPALFEQIGGAFRARMREWAHTEGVPVIRFAAKEHKADVLAPFLQAAAAEGASAGSQTSGSLWMPGLWNTRATGQPGVAGVL